MMGRTQVGREGPGLFDHIDPLPGPELAIQDPLTQEEIPHPPWSWWSGQQLQSTPEVPLSIDTETTLVDLNRVVPQLVLASASDGQTTVIIKPEDVESFLIQHQGEHFVFHNVSFDFWVLDKHLDKCSILWHLAEEGRLHDSMLLDMLVRLAKGEGEAPTGGEAKFYRRTLAQLGKKYQATYSFSIKEKGKGKKKKTEEEEPEDPIRLRYKELLDQPDWLLVDPSFFHYPAKDVYTTWEIYPKLLREAHHLMGPFQFHPGIFPGCEKSYGILTEKLQVQGAIALAKLGRAGILINKPEADILEASLRTEITSHLDYLKKYHSHLLKFKKSGEIKLTPRAKTPCLQHKELQKVLSSISEVTQTPLLISPGKKKGISVSWKAWSEYETAHPFLGAWIGAASLTKMLEFFDLFRNSEYLHCRYDPLKRTGRTSAENRIQQIPQDEKFRSLFIARPGYKMITVDFAGIELRVWATICLHCFGHSRMAEIFQLGPPRDDVHSFTTSMILGEPFEHVLQHKKEEKYSKNRKLSKALIFGRMGGLGPDKFVGYAAAKPYYVTVSVEEARDLIGKLHEAYPELDDWLASSHLDDFSLNLGLSRPLLESYLQEEFPGLPPDMILSCLVKVLYGKPVKADGTPYKPRWKAQMWQLVVCLLSRSSKPIPEKISSAVLAKSPSPALSMFFSSSTAVTLTGRVRAGLSYTESKNAPFQGLAADGAKLALWRLIKEDYRTVAFVHDELLIEVPEATAQEEEAKINNILCEEMAKVINQLVPISVESHLGPCWQK